MERGSSYLAVDMGASGVRAVVGRLHSGRFELRELHRFENGPAELLGHLHWDVLGLWRGLKAGMERFAGEVGGELAGIGVDTWGVDFALLDERGRILGNPYHYRDARTDGAPEELFRSLPEDRVYGRTGIQVMQINTLFQLFSMKRESDPQLEAAHTLLMMPDLFSYLLSGAKVGEYTIASTSQMLDARRREWASGFLSELGLPTRLLPELVRPGTIIGTLRPELAQATGVGPVPVIATAAHDTASAVAAIPELSQESAYISSGTWSLVGVEVAEPVLSEEARQLNFTNEGGVAGTIRLLKNVAGLWLLQECRRQWRREGNELSWNEILQSAAAAPPFRSIVDPDSSEFLNPGDMPVAIRSFCRRTGQPEPESVGELARCCLESLALRYRWVIGALESLTGRRLTTIRVVGGGSRNDTLNRFTADACNLPVVVGPVEATAYGNVMVQALATGELPDLASGRRAIGDSVERRCFEPQAPSAWDEPFERFQALLAK
jgi:rhamnulokinase